MSVEEGASEALTSVPPMAPRKLMTRQEKRGQMERVRRFLALPPELQEGALRYAENIKIAYCPPSKI